MVSGTSGYSCLVPLFNFKPLLFDIRADTGFLLVVKFLYDVVPGKVDISLLAKCMVSVHCWRRLRSSWVESMWSSGKELIDQHLERTWSPLL